jgi:plastocyanin
MRVAWPARLGISLLLFAGALAAGCASTGGVRGQVQGPPAGHTPSAKFDDTIVYLVPHEPEPESGHAKANLIVDENGFTPHVLPVSVGTRVIVRNKNHLFHNAFSVSPAKSFDVGAVPPGEERSVVFDRAGVVAMFCELHPKESATIVVVPTRRFARVDPSGSFHFSRVPPGAYTLNAWHPERGEVKREVQMPARGDLQVTLPY